MKKVKAKNNKTKVSVQNQNLKMAITVKNLVIKYRDIKKFSLRKDLFKAKKATTLVSVGKTVAANQLYCVLLLVFSQLILELSISIIILFPYFQSELVFKES